MCVCVGVVPILHAFWLQSLLQGYDNALNTFLDSEDRIRNDGRRNEIVL